MDPIQIEDRIEIILLYGESRRNVSQTINLFIEKFPEKNPPSRASIYRIVNKFLKDGNVTLPEKKRRKTATGEDNVIAVAAAINVNPQISSRTIARDSGISKTSVLRILKQLKLKPYHMSMHQQLQGNDFNNRMLFCQWALEMTQLNRNFFFNVLFSDESSFTNHGQVNRHNMHYWSIENPHWLREVEHQRPWTVNVWCGIMGDKVIGPYFIDGTLNGEKYRNFLDEKLPQLLEDVPLSRRRCMWFQHDGCPAHNSIVARNVLNRDYNGRWIGRGGPVNWPARSPDLTAPDFFLWGYLKDKVYNQKPSTAENMKERIKSACEHINNETLLNVHANFMQRVQICIAVEGQHFEHLILK